MTAQSMELPAETGQPGPIAAARQFLTAGNHMEAARCCREALQEGTNVADALTLLGTIGTLTGNTNEAIVLLRLAASIASDNVKTLNALALAYRARKQYAEAHKHLMQALRLDPGAPELLWNLAHVLFDQKNWAECTRVFDAIFQRGLARPKDYHPRAWALHHLKRYADAERAFQRMVADDPANGEGWYGLAYLRYEIQNVHGAIRDYRRATQANPRFVLAYVNLTAIFIAHSSIDAALATTRAALEIDSSDTQLYVNYALALVALGKPKDALAAIRRALAGEPGNFKWKSNELLYSHYPGDVTTRQLFELHREWDFIFGRMMVQHRRPFAAERAEPERRLRIGYVSPDFRGHSCASFLFPLFTDRDRERFEVYCYSKASRADATTGRFQELSDHWREISDRSPIDVAAQVRQDEIDILIDLTGHTARHSLMVFAQKPAPVQLTWLGYPGSTGLSSIDYRISDDWLTPEGTPELFSEQLYRLGRLSHCYTPEPDAPPVAPLPALRNGYVTFGSFNNFAKLSDATVTLWTLLLKAAPTARVCLKSRYIGSPEAREHILSRFRAAGADLDRIEFLGGREAKGDHLAIYEAIDIGIDTYPYGGMTTSCEALWMGVPILTLAGDRTEARYGTSLMNAVGLPQFVTSSPEAFAARAAELTADLDGLARLRAGLRDRVAASELCDGAGFTRAMEAAYRDVWRRWCATQTR